MRKTAEILSDTSHRPYPYPNGPWRFYQEWNRALFMHWEVPAETLREMVPQKLSLDTFNGKAYVSVVPFTMEKIRPRFLPSVGFISNFHEINVRTYVEADSKKGVYFLSMEAQKWLSAVVSKKISGLPYEKSYINRTQNEYRSANKKNAFTLDVEFSIGAAIPQKTALENWLTERYCLYLDKNSELYRFDVHHRAWELQNLEIKRLSIDYQIGPLVLSTAPNLANYSDGVKVLAWGKKKL